MDLTTITPTPAMLRALAHPVRLRMLGILRLDGPATATTLATRLGLNSGATSYHLRQLAQHGFVVEDAELGNGRDRWWRAAHRSTYTEEPDPADREAQETLDAYLQAVVTVYTERLQRAVEELPLLPQEWRKSVTFSDWLVRLSPGKARAVTEALAEIAAAAEDEETDDAVDFVLQISAFPQPGRLGGEE